MWEKNLLFTLMWEKNYKIWLGVGYVQETVWWYVGWVCIDTMPYGMDTLTAEYADVLPLWKD